MKRATLMMSAAFVLAVSLPRAEAQGQAVGLREGARALLAFPVSSLKRDTHFSGWSPNGKKTSLDAVVERGVDGVSVNGDSAWKLAGFPSLIEIEVTKIKYDAGEGRTRVDVKAPRWGEVRLFFKGQKEEAAGLFAAVSVVPAERDAYLRAAYATLAKHFLADGPLADLPEEKQVTLARYAHVGARGAKIRTATYKEKVYLVVSIPSSDTVYNDLRMNSAQRIAKVLNDSLLVAMKAFASVVADVESVYGLKLEVGVLHRPFTGTSENEIDNVEIYAPSAEIKRFAEADITSQDLIAKSVVIVNSNRVEVRLSES